MKVKTKDLVCIPERLARLSGLLPNEEEKAYIVSEAERLTLWADDLAKSHFPPLKKNTAVLPPLREDIPSENEEKEGFFFTVERIVK